MKKIFLTKFIIIVFLFAILAIPTLGANQAPSPPSDLQQRVMHLQQLMALSKKKPGTAQGQEQSAKAPDSMPAPAQVQAQPAGPGQGQPAEAQGGALAQVSVLDQPPATNNTVSSVDGSAQLSVTGASGETAGAADGNSRQKINVNQGDMYDQAFNGVVSQLLPMSPDQITKLREVFSETQLAAATPAGVPPKPTTTSLMVNLSPQAAPPIIRLGAGYISSLVFMDSTGQPWPIAAYSIGDPNAFNIQWDKKGNTLLVQSSSFFKRSNLAVILKDLNTPVMLTLLAGQGAVDYRVDLRIPGVGPNAMLVQNGLPDVANPELLEVLNGVPPRGSKQLKVIGGDAQAWINKSKLFVRTSLDIISPAWQAVMTSIDGTHAYLLQPSPVILALQRGKDKTLTLNLEGIE